ncbi:MAG: class I SAM-dependent methyltransferase [Anaerolineales bacterium]|nr:class I SAM-dependent methyltransferase [Anaerolineales bacterium]
MFHDIPPAIQTQMRRLEAIDAHDRRDGTPHLQRLRQIPPETGRFLALLAATAPAGRIVEIGTSAGYSTLWLTRAGRPITTFEILEEKAALAGETFHLAGVEAAVTLVQADARQHLPEIKEIALCFLDAEKEFYAECYALVIPALVPGGLLVADNAISHAEALQPMLERALHDGRVDALVLPLGKGLLLCRKV